MPNTHTTESTVEELVAQLKANGQATYGKKKDLQERLEKKTPKKPPGRKPKGIAKNVKKDKGKSVGFDDEEDDDKNDTNDKKLEWLMQLGAITKDQKAALQLLTKDKNTTLSDPPLSGHAKRFIKKCSKSVLIQAVEEVDPDFKTSGQSKMRLAAILAKRGMLTKNTKATLQAILKEFDPDAFDRDVMKKQKDKIATGWTKDELLEEINYQLNHETDSEDSENDSDSDSGSGSDSE